MIGRYIADRFGDDYHRVDLSKPEFTQRSVGHGMRESSETGDAKISFVSAVENSLGRSVQRVG